MNIDSEYMNLDFFDVDSVIQYILSNYMQFLLLLSVFVIIYTVDYISNVNNILFSATQIIPGINNSINLIENKKTNKKTNKRTNKRK
jgi:type III secretory pathway component EscU